MPTGLLRVKRFGDTLMDNFTPIHDVDLIGKLPAEIEILFDEQDRHASDPRASAAHSPIRGSP